MKTKSSWFGAVAALVVLAVSVGCSKDDKAKEASLSPPDEASPGPTPTKAAPPAAGILSPGMEAPDFTAVAHSGEKVELNKLRGKKVVLYFYPKDNTPGCTVEAQGFRDAHQTYQSRDVVVIGVSTQDNESHREFAEEHGLPFLLIPDEERAIAKSYGVGSMLGMSKRVTFLIGPDGKVKKVYESVSPKEHAAELLADLDDLKL